MLLLSAVFIMSSIITILLGTKIKSGITNSDTRELVTSSNNVTKTIGSGYAYTVDIGDSMIVVVVIDKRNVGSDFLSVQPLPIKIQGDNE